MLTITLTILLLAAVIGLFAGYFHFTKDSETVDFLRAAAFDARKDAQRAEAGWATANRKSIENRRLYEVNLEAAQLKQKEIDRLQGILDINNDAAKHNANRLEQLEEFNQDLLARERLYLKHMEVAAVAIAEIADNKALAHNTAKRLTNRAISAQKELSAIAEDLFDQLIESASTDKKFECVIAK